MWRKLLCVVLVVLMLFAVVAPVQAVAPLAAIPAAYYGLAVAVAAAGGMVAAYDDIAGEQRVRALAQYVWDSCPSLRPAIIDSAKNSRDYVFLSAQAQYEIVAAHRALDNGEIQVLRFHADKPMLDSFVCGTGAAQSYLVSNYFDDNPLTEGEVAFQGQGNSVYGATIRLGGFGMDKATKKSDEVVVKWDLKWKYDVIHSFMSAPDSPYQGLIEVSDGVVNIYWGLDGDGLGLIYSVEGVLDSGRVELRSAGVNVSIYGLGGEGVIDADEAVDLNGNVTDMENGDPKRMGVPEYAAAGAAGGLIVDWLDDYFNDQSNVPDYSPAEPGDAGVVDEGSDVPMVSWLSGIWQALQQLVAQVGSLVRALNIVNMLKAVRAAVIEWVIPSPDFFPAWAATFASVWGEKFGGYAGAFGALRDAFAAEGAAPKWYVAGHLMIDFADYESLYSKIRICLGGFISALTVVWVLRTFKPRQTID